MPKVARPHDDDESCAASSGTRLRLDFRPQSHPSAVDEASRLVSAEPTPLGIGKRSINPTSTSRRCGEGPRSLRRECRRQFPYAS